MSDETSPEILFKKNKESQQIAEKQRKQKREFFDLGYEWFIRPLAKLSAKIALSPIELAARFLRYEALKMSRPINGGKVDLEKDYWKSANGRPSRITNLRNQAGRLRSQRA